jgi:hypothetical protein
VITDSHENRTVGFTDRANDDLATDLTEDLRARVKSELEPGERLLWAARSYPPPVAIGVGSLFVSTVGLIILALGVGALASAHDYSQREQGTLACLVGCVLIGGTIASWFLRRVGRLRMSHFCYAVTDRRAIIWSPSRNGALRVVSLPRGRVKSLARVEHPDGSGNLEFNGPNYSEYNPWYECAFQHIPEVRRVEQIVRHNLMKDEGREV